MVHSIKNKTKNRLVLRLLARNNQEHIYCPYCHVELNEDNYSLDHIIPRSKGGRRSCISNVELICRECNQLKSNINPLTSQKFLDFVLTNRHYDIPYYYVLFYSNKCLMDSFAFFNVNVKVLVLIKLRLMNIFNQYNDFLASKRVRNVDNYRKHKLNISYIKSFFLILKNRHTK